jgi:hypothetical protein
MNGSRRRVLAGRVVTAIVGAAILLQLVRAVPRGVSNLFLPYWRITYAHGYVRRGLLGTVFQFFAGGFPPNEQEMQVFAVHVLALTALLAGVVLEAARLWRAALPRTRLLLATGTATFLLSRFVLTVANCGGYPDVILLLIALLAYALLARGRLAPALALATVAPFIHEAFVFLWAPVALLSLASKEGSTVERARHAALLALPGLAAVAAVKLHSDAALHASMATFPISPADRDAVLRFAYGLSIGEAFEATTRGYREHPLNVVLGVLWVLPYSAAIAACAVSLGQGRSRRRAVVTAALATLVPCAIGLIAWDFSRFLVWSTFGAELALLAAAESAGRERAATEPPLTPRELALPATWLVAIALLSTGPHVFLYASDAFVDWPFGPAALQHTPGGAVGLAFADVFNRERRTGYAMTDDRCQPEIDRANVKRSGEACAFDVAAPGFLLTPPLRMPSGRYVAKLTTRADPRCSAVRARVQALAFSRTGGERGAATLTAPGDLAVPFEVSPNDAATATLRVEVHVDEGCLRVERFEVTR